MADGGEGTLAVLAEPLGLRHRAALARNPWGVVATGGSATTDGGFGALRAIDERGGLRGTPVTILTDVTTPYAEAARVFDPQKGADAGQVAALTLRLHHRARLLRRDPTYVPRTGAAGGFAGAMWAQFDAELVSGADHVLNTLSFDDHLADAEAVVVGEGRLDVQSSQGKIVSAVSAVLARSAGIACFAVAGSVGADLGPLREEFMDVTVASDEAAMEAAGRAIGQRLRLRLRQGTGRRALG
ncbi:glycerate kinase [Streptomyces milbemycinicus]|uniref:Glycerate kinase n=1 Tax=Streptomyces milbemycinicus TaxID=476552 RepID=A0ABW8M0W0_9ACTN